MWRWRGGYVRIGHIHLRRTGVSASLALPVSVGYKRILSFSSSFPSFGGMFDHAALQQEVVRRFIAFVSLSGAESWRWTVILVPSNPGVLRKKKTAIVCLIGSNSMVGFTITSCEKRPTHLHIHILAPLFSMKSYLKTLHAFQDVQTVLMTIDMLPLNPRFISKQRDWFSRVQKCAVVTNFPQVVRHVRKWISRSDSGTNLDNVRFFKRTETGKALSYLQR